MINTASGNNSDMSDEARRLRSLLNRKRGQRVSQTELVKAFCEGTKYNLSDFERATHELGDVIQATRTGKEIQYSLAPNAIVKKASNGQKLQQGESHSLGDNTNDSRLAGLAALADRLHAEKTPQERARKVPEPELSPITRALRRQNFSNPLSSFSNEMIRDLAIVTLLSQHPEGLAWERLRALLEVDGNRLKDRYGSFDIPSFSVKSIHDGLDSLGMQIEVLREDPKDVFRITGYNELPDYVTSEKVQGNIVYTLTEEGQKLLDMREKLQMKNNAQRKIGPLQLEHRQVFEELAPNILMAQHTEIFKADLMQMPEELKERTQGIGFMQCKLTPKLVGQLIEALPALRIVRFDNCTAIGQENIKALHGKYPKLKIEQVNSPTFEENQAAIAENNQVMANSMSAALQLLRKQPIEPQNPLVGRSSFGPNRNPFGRG